MSYGLLRAIHDAETRGDHERAQRLRAALQRRVASDVPFGPPEPPIPLPTRAETIRRMCELYGADKHADYLIASGADPAQAAATLGVLGDPGAIGG